MDKLKPCPFCGHEAMASYNTRYDFQVYCTNDACFMSQIIMEAMETEEQAIAAWNKRAPAAPSVLLDKLCEFLADTLHTPAPCYGNEEICHHMDFGYCRLPDAPDVKECWKGILTKWMEELNE